MRLKVLGVLKRDFELLARALLLESKLISARTDFATLTGEQLRGRTDLELLGVFLLHARDHAGPRPLALRLAEIIVGLVA